MNGAHIPLTESGDVASGGQSALKGKDFSAAESKSSGETKSSGKVKPDAETEPSGKTEPNIESKPNGKMSGDEPSDGSSDPDTDKSAKKETQGKAEDPSDDASKTNDKEEDEPTDSENTWKRGVKHTKEEYAKEDARIQSDIKSGKFSTKVDVQKQNAHIPGTSQYQERIEKGVRTSRLNINLDEVQDFVNAGAGKGKISHSGNYPNQVQEIIECHKLVGYVVKIDGSEYPTTKLKIHYSSSGVHVVPTLE